MAKYQLPVGTGPIKRTRPYNTLTDLQKEIYKKVYDPVNGILFFAENCCYVNRNGIQFEKLYVCNFSLVKTEWKNYYNSNLYFMVCNDI